MVCFAVYSASKAIAQAHRAVLAPWELTYTQYIAMLTVGDSDEGLTVSDLGERMGLDSGTLSPLLRRLEHRGLVVRERSQHDERVVTVTATDVGRAARQELLDAIGPINRAYGFSSLDEAQTLVSDLHRITDGMNRVTAGLRT